MAVKKHPAWAEELKRLDYTRQVLEQTLVSLDGRQQQIDREVEFGRKHFVSSDSDSYSNLMVNTKLQGWLERKRRSLQAAWPKPYFVRIDFWEDNRRGAEQLYIGKTSLTREDNQELVIVDWRAPVSTLYYEGRLGRASYQSPEGEIKGELQLKRQIAVAEGELQEILDIDITTSDEFLQPYLSASADNRLKDIVATIQVEQNRIIRAEVWKPLVVQGAAGSGKTTIALHRIAYLIYTYEKTLQPENFLIIAPSRLFLNYISAVLPELGVEQVRQTTFADLTREWLGEDFALQDTNAKLLSFIDRSPAASGGVQSRLWRGAEFKSSVLWIETIDAYLAEIERSMLPEGAFSLGSEMVVPADEIRDLWFSEYRDLSCRKRIERLANLLANRLERARAQQVEQLQNRCNRRVEAFKQMLPDDPDRKELLVSLIDQKNREVEAVNAAAQPAVAEFIARFALLSPLEYYRRLFANPARFDRLVGNRADGELRSYIRDYSRALLAVGTLETEDLAPLLYLRHRLWGIEEETPVRHTVVDEAQDLSVFQLFVLRAVLKDSAFTILGDLCQGIHAYRGVRDWQEVLTDVFRGGAGFVTLEQSYRTTVEIMEAAKQVIAHLPGAERYPIRPVIRHGEPVGLHQRAGQTAADILARVQELRAAGWRSVAVIGKTAAECAGTADGFHQAGEELQLLTGSETEYRGGLVIAPSYLVKGLEFDAVVIADAGVERYRDEVTDIRLLYVAMTRALHHLEIFYCGEPSPLLKSLAKNN